MKRAKHRSKGKGLHPSPFFCFKDYDKDYIFWFVTLCMVLGIMGMIFHFSAANSTASSQSSQGICRIILGKVQKIVPFLFEKISMDEMVELIETPVRKLAHFSEYAIYSFCMQLHLFFGWNIYRKYSMKKMIFKTPKIAGRKAFILSGGVFCVLYAVSDEIHQAFVPGRACRFFDVCVDSFGVLTGILLFLILCFPFLDGRCRKGYNEEKNSILQTLSNHKKEGYTMILSQLLDHVDYKCIQGTLDQDVSAVVNDSRKLEEGCLFLCIKGASFDGHSFAEEAVKKGASVLVVQDDVTVPDDVTVIKVADTRKAMALISAAWFGYPAKELKTIAVTGTKGKTTTTYMIKEMLEAAGMKTGVIGTIEVVIGEEHIPVNNTTPESYDIHKYFRQMADAGCKCVVMEASSQGFKLDRTAGIEFDYGLFTNLSPDHIGPNEHENFEEYLACKAMLFKQCKEGFANIDDAHYEQIVKDAACPVRTFGLKEEADLCASDIELTRDTDFLGVDFTVKGLFEGKVSCGIPGTFNVHNALGAMIVVRAFGLTLEQINQTLRHFTVKGRVQIVPTGYDYTLIIDYAHNAIALESILNTLRAYNPPRLVSLFGCGGNRSKLRRFEMGEVSGNLADLTVITSDNPRNEDPNDIINDIITGIEKTDGKYISIVDRREAISYVMHHGEPGDIIILAGKGHETYQEINGVKYHMSEEEIVQDVLDGKY